MVTGKDAGNYSCQQGVELGKSHSKTHHVITSNLAEVRRRIALACLKAGRSVQDVKLLLATKTVALENIRMAIQAGATLIGENKVQEVRSKQAGLQDLNVEQHFIGHLQTNKIKGVLDHVTCIQSVDRMELAVKLHQRLQTLGRKLDILVQVNTSFEPSKFGLHPGEVGRFLEKINTLSSLRIKGFMTIGLFNADQELVKKSFSLLREIRDKHIANGLLAGSAQELSMGMSGDFETAIAEGATIIRIGTAVFGERIYPDSYYWNEQEMK